RDLARLPGRREDARRAPSPADPGLHTHIGSGADPAVWTRVAHLVLEIVERLPDVTTVSLGGGFKVARVPGEEATDIVAIGSLVKEAFIAFQRQTGRALRLEIEPGT